MPEFTAKLECDMFDYEVKADISEMGVNVLEVYFGEAAMNIENQKHFIKMYGSADLDDEIMHQYEEELKDQREDCMIESFLINKMMDGAA